MRIGTLREAGGCWQQRVSVLYGDDVRSACCAAPPRFGTIMDPVRARKGEVGGISARVVSRDMEPPLWL